MNRLIRCVISFVLPFFCLLISVSNAEIQTDVAYYPYSLSFSSTISVDSPFPDYTFEQIFDITYDYALDPTDSNLSAVKNMCDYIDDCGYVIQLMTWEYTGYNTYCEVVIYKKGDGELGVAYNANPNHKNRIDFIFKPNSTSYELYVLNRYSNTSRFAYANKLTDSEFEANFVRSTQFDNVRNTPVFTYCNTNVKNMTYNSSAGRWYWDGTYFYEYSESGGEDTPSLPSNAEIASAVQAFYNSDYYKNNKDFSDFMVLYNYDTKYFDFIGHNFGNKLGQQIIDADIEIGSPPVSYSQRWWHYFLPNELLNTLFNKYYWLYSTNDFGENIKYEGKGSINDLLDLHFSTRSIIVYSTTDYPVNTILKNDNGETESTADIIPGDQYTYDETLDPTTNEYNPIKDYIPTDPTQSILGEVDFDEINKVFEENKNILDIENASWLFTANNQLINYFVGFISFLIVLIIISRLLGG